MNGITKLNSHAILINGETINGTVRKLNDDVSFEEAKELVTADGRKDGYDTIAATLNGDRILISAETDINLQDTDQLQIDGTKANIEFVENEMNAPAERWSRAAGLGMVGGITGAFGGMIGSLVFDRFIGSTKAVGMILAATTIGGATIAGVIGKNMNPPDGTLLNSISSPIK